MAPTTYLRQLAGLACFAPGLRSPVNADGIGVGTPLPTVASKDGVSLKPTNHSPYGTIKK